MSLLSWYLQIWKCFYLYRGFVETIPYFMEQKKINNVKETEWRELERVEESVLLKVFKTVRSCPCHLIYLEAGIVPARFHVMRQMIMYLQYILMHPSSSLLQRVYQTQRKKSLKGHWASETAKRAYQLEINMSDQEIQNMKRSKFKV